MCFWQEYYRSAAVSFSVGCIERVVYEQGYPDDFSIELFNEAGIKLEKFTENEQF